MLVKVSKGGGVWPLPWKKGQCDELSRGRSSRGRVINEPEATTSALGSKYLPVYVAWTEN